MTNGFLTLEIKYEPMEKFSPKAETDSFVEIGSEADLEDFSVPIDAKRKDFRFSIGKFLFDSQF